jgi:hypothetical protein
MEQHLVDQLAQFQTMMWCWQEVQASYGAICGATREPKRNERPSSLHREPPRVSNVEAAQMAMGMVERFHRLYLNTLRALQDLRRGGRVVVRGARQVNIGARQINLSGGG